MATLIGDCKHPIKLFYGPNEFLPGRQVILISDMHGQCEQAINILEEMGVLSESIVFTMGDMAGDGRMGADGDPIESYRRLLQLSDKFYLVQGNHDLFNPDVYTLVNDDGTRCALNETKIEIDGVTIGGLDGIIGEKNPGKHIYTRDDYIRRLKQLGGVDILLTHDLPAVSCTNRHPGVPLDAIKVTNCRIHAFGHHQLESFKSTISGVLCYSMDRRVLIMY